jgi:small redox-active disulfide protein 2
MNIKILGGGCPNCILLYNSAAAACRELEIDAVIEKIVEYEKISEYGVMSTPALVINEKVVGMKYKKVKELIKNA